MPFSVDAASLTAHGKPCIVQAQSAAPYAAEQPAEGSPDAPSGAPLEA